MYPPVEDTRAIDAVVRAFFTVFDSRRGRRPTLEVLHDVCVAQCVIVKATTDGPILYDLPGFITPRSQLLSGREPFETQGVKSIQLVKTGDDWKISAVACDDERADLAIPSPGR